MSFRFLNYEGSRNVERLFRAPSPGSQAQESSGGGCMDKGGFVTSFAFSSVFESRFHASTNICTSFVTAGACDTALNGFNQPVQSVTGNLAGAKWDVMVLS